MFHHIYGQFNENICFGKYWQRNGIAKDPIPHLPVWSQTLTFVSVKSAPCLAQVVDKAPRPSINNVIWILSSDSICQLNQLFFSNSEALYHAQVGQTRRGLPTSTPSRTYSAICRRRSWPASRCLVDFDMTVEHNLILFTSGCSLVRDAHTAHGRHATATGKVRQKGFFGGVNISSWNHHTCLNCSFDTDGDDDIPIQRWNS